MPPRARPGRSLARHRRKEAVDDDLLDLLARDTAPNARRRRASTPAPSSVIDVDSGASSPSSCSFAARQRSTSCERLPGREPRVVACPRSASRRDARARGPCCRRRASGGCRRRCASSTRLAVLHRDLDEREVGRAAADVADQHEPRIARVRRRAFRDDGTASRRTRPAALRAAAALRSPAMRAASSVSARAPSSNDAGTVSTTSCASSGASGKRCVPRRAHVREIARARRRPARSSRRRRPRPTGRIGARRSTDRMRQPAFRARRRAVPAPARRACARAGRSRPAGASSDRRSPTAVADRRRRARRAPRDSAATARAAAPRLRPGSTS